MTDAPALKPCPFCRGIARIGGEALYVSARCSKCSATVGWVLKPGEEADAVISAWNTRADLIDMDVLRRVEKILVYHLERARSGDGKYIPCSEFNIGLTENGITDLRAMMEKLK